MNIKPFHFYSIKVLPTVYDDALSYYECLGKVTKKLNEVIEYINNNLEQIIREQIDDLVLDTMYDETTETLILRVGKADE